MVRLLARSRFLVLAAVSLCLSRTLQAGENGAPKPLTAILNAYRPEMEAMIKEFGLRDGGFTEQRLKGFRYYQGHVEGQDVVVFETGMSLVNAAMALQLALDHLPIARVLFAGVAGGTDPSLHVGDVVIPERWAYHCEAAYFNPAPDGRSWLPARYFTQHYPNFGLIFPDDAEAIRADRDKFEPTPFFPADPGLLALARRAVEKLGPIRYGASAREITVLVGGVGVTGSVFVDNREYRKFLHSTWGARCTDMESAAYAHVCFTNEIPFLAVRALSDLAGGQDVGELNAAEDNEHGTSENAVRVLRAILRELPPATPPASTP